MNSSEESVRWFVLETKQDFCIVKASAILYNDEISVGDEVVFFWTKNTRLNGTVRFISYDSTACELEAKKLNVAAKKQLESSFHEDRPRKAALKFKESLKGNITKHDATYQKSKRAKRDPTLEEKMRRVAHSELLLKPGYQPKNKDKPIYDSDSTCCDDDEPFTQKKSASTPTSSSKMGAVSFSKGAADDTSPHDLDNSDKDTVEYVSEGDDSDESTDQMEEKDGLMKVTAQLAAKFDLELLKKLASGQVPIPLDSPFPNNALWDSSSSKLEKQKSASDPKKTSLPERKIDHTSHKSVSSGCKGSDSAGGKLQVAQHQIHGVDNTFKGKMYLCAKGPDTVEVFENTGIYCTQDNYLKAENATSATMVARRLCEGVFTKEALLQCSVTGLPPRGKGKDTYQNPSIIKPYLCPKAVNAIVCQATYWQKKKHFLKKKDDSQIRQAIGVRMNELQHKHSTANRDGGD